MGRLSFEMSLGRLGMKQKLNGKYSDGKIVSLNGVGLGFDVVVNGWCGIVGRGVLGIVHSGVDAEVDGMVTVLC